MDPIEHVSTASGGYKRISEPVAVSDAVKSSELEHLVKFDLTKSSTDSLGQSRETVADNDKSQIQKLIEDSVDELNSELQRRHTSVSFWIDKETDSVVVQVVESESGKVIRQIPPDEILAMRNRLKELTGMIIDTEG